MAIFQNIPFCDIDGRDHTGGKKTLSKPWRVQLARHKLPPLRVVLPQELLATGPK